MYRPGEDLGRYRIVETIGLGGMGVVYRGRDTVLGRDVAIKAMTGNVASDPGLRHRFLQELENAPRIVHPFVATVFDVVDRPEGPLLVMERVEGERFDHFLQEQAPPLHTIARLGAEIAEALTAIHGVGIVHRDLKPGNVLVTPDVHPKVMDFGVALRLPGFDRTDLITHASGERQTDSGAVVGTIRNQATRAIPRRSSRTTSTSRSWVQRKDRRPPTSRGCSRRWLPRKPMPIARSSRAGSRPQAARPAISTTAK